MPEPRQPEDAQFVESGSFRVDRARAIEKLSAFRSPGMGPVLFWTRLAAAAGAQSVRLTSRCREIELRFDGLPLPARALRDPFSALFDQECRSTAQERFFALGIVHAWRPALAGLTVCSGRGGDRLRLDSPALGQETVSLADDGDGATVIRLSLKGEDPGFWLHPIPARSLACRPLSQLWAPCPVERFEGDRLVGRVARGPAKPGELAFDEDGVVGHLSIPDDPSGRARVDVYHYGVLVGTEVFRRVSPPIVGKVDDRGLSLSADSTSIVRNERLARLERGLHRRAHELALKVAREQVDALPQAAALMRSKTPLHELWVRRIERGAAMEVEALEARLVDDLPLPRWGVPMPWPTREERSFVLREACTTLWLRDVCQAAAGGPWSSVAPELRAAPIYLSRSMEPLSWEDLNKGALALTESSFESERCRILRRSSEGG